MPHLRLLTVVLPLVVTFAGCTPSGWVSPERAALLRDPPQETLARIRAVTPAALRWYREVEQRLSPRGKPLTAKQKLFAKSLGIADPDKVRILALDPFPLPTDPALRRLARELDFASVYTLGRTFGHLIITQPGFETDDRLITHELSHVAQFERLGAPVMVPRLLLELTLLGYSNAPLENEAYRRERARL